jgi:deoxyribodipyrimidine photo-lyase
MGRMSISAEAGAVVVWFREDLRLADNPALRAAVATGGPVIPLYVLDEGGPGRAPGAASRWWLDKSLAALAASLEAQGSRLILRRGESGVEIERLAAETGARAVVWNRVCEPALAAGDDAIQAGLARRGIAARSFDSALLLAPGAVRSAAGGAFKVFTAFWRAARPRLEDVEALPAPDRLRPPPTWPTSEPLSDWGLHPSRPDWSSGFEVWTPGEAGAAARLDRFLDAGLAGYAQRRDRPDCEGTSRLSAHLHWGEISPRQVWRAVRDAVVVGEAREDDGEKFLAELGWREFNAQLLQSMPQLASRNVQPRFDRFAWREDPGGLEAWRRGRTGYPMVDAGLRELWATGLMHNRVRMIAASFLTKHLMIDWRAGEAWFWDTLVDADAANNAANWQWVAGSGADAAPYFRVFNPTLQGQRFDPDGGYVRRWIPELRGLPGGLVHEPWRAGPSQRGGYPDPIVRHDLARARALAAYADLQAVA